MPLRYFEEEKKERVALTMNSIIETIQKLVDWNKIIEATDDYYKSQEGMQLLAANCMLITAIGEGINRINRIMPDFLLMNFPDIPWADIIGMRNRIAHGYFELDAEIIYDTIKNEIPLLGETIIQAKGLLFK